MKHTVRHVLPGLLAILCLAACTDADHGAPANDSDAEARRTRDVAAVEASHRALIAAFEAGDAEAIVALLDDGPDLVVFHPFLENRFEGIQEARDGIARMLTRVGKLEWSEVHEAVHVNGNVGWVTSQILARTPARPRPFIGRGTEIWIRHEEGWHLIHGHWSHHAGLAEEAPPQ